MALISCPKCGNEVSDTEDVCIGCGYSLKDIRKKSIAGKIKEKLKENEQELLLILMLLIFAVFWWPLYLVSFILGLAMYINKKQGTSDLSGSIIEKPERETEIRPEPKPAPEPRPESEPKPAPEPDPVPQPEPQPKLETIPEPQFKPEPKLEQSPAVVKTYHYLSDLQTESGAPKQFEEADMVLLEKLGDEFFRDCQQVMVKEPGNTPELRLLAITRIGQLLTSFRKGYYSFADHTECQEPGYLRYYCYWCSGGICYDGGCYSDEPDESRYLCVRRITREQYEAIRNNPEKRTVSAHKRWFYTSDLPDTEDVEVFFREERYNEWMYLRDPMGIMGYFEIMCEYI